MSDNRRDAFSLADLARVTPAEPLDYRALFEEEVKRRRDMEGQIGALRARVSTLSAQHQNDDASSRRLRQINGRLDDMRRGMCARLMAALIIRNGSPQGEAIVEMAELAVDCTDALMNTLMATRRGKAR